MAKITSIELSEQDARDILTTAIEAGYYGIGYWANDHGPITIDRDRQTLDITRAQFKAENEQGVVRNYDITTAKIQKAAQKIAQDEHYAGLISDIIEGDVDSDGADNIVQFACFGKVIYG